MFCWQLLIPYFCHWRPNTSQEEIHFYGELLVIWKKSKISGTILWANFAWAFTFSVLRQAMGLPLSTFCFNSRVEEVSGSAPKVFTTFVGLIVLRTVIWLPRHLSSFCVNLNSFRKFWLLRGTVGLMSEVSPCISFAKLFWRQFYCCLHYVSTRGAKGIVSKFVFFCPTKTLFVLINFFSALDLFARTICSRICSRHLL